MLRLMKARKEEENIFHDIIECLVAALEAKDPYTKGHSTRVADMAYDLAQKIGLKGKTLNDVHIAAHLHDIGKIGIPDNILNKKERLTPKEWRHIQRHAEIGYEILNKSGRLRDIAIIVLHHHERWDGKGYPLGKKGKEIPLGSRLIAICDSIDAITSERPYRRALSWDECRQEIMVNKGTQFDPFLIEAVHKMWPEWQDHYSTMSRS
ncbi:HD domain-containing protein [Thermanaerosceptrum fracticalcis]|uniref:HD domain-containing protein n=1 Tax=Thermanaerosceptrum fracticalcis TaxID=1712410 RepID=A0A7G6E2Y5_THEFR|nr:HD-GYP domain-containing protein [Thermanaerosceptrum fracticalcis]QNB46439.1 HD domain-containing protein [Thermanaerosceptrum fracticalcis]